MAYTDLEVGGCDTSPKEFQIYGVQKSKFPENMQRTSLECKIILCKKEYARLSFCYFLKNATDVK